MSTSNPFSRYYYTQFIGDANDLPIISGSANFSGIALIDTDIYIPDGDGSEWCESTLCESNRVHCSDQNSELNHVMLNA